MLDEETAEAHVDDMLDAADELEPGFDMVNDISTFKPMSPEAKQAIERGKEGLTERDMSAVVRVTGESALGELQFSRVGTDKEGYHVATAETRMEAERLLDEFRREGPDADGA